MPGESDIHQLVKIFEIFGTPNPNNWPVKSIQFKECTLIFLYINKNVNLLPDFVELNPMAAKPLRIIFSAATADIIAVLESMLQLNPNNRCTCRQVIAMIVKHT